LIEGLERAGKEAPVAVLDGAGDAFCVGKDVEWLRRVEVPAGVEEFVTLVGRGSDAIETALIPIVAATDLAIATEVATFGLPEMRIGAYPGYAIERVALLGTKKRFIELALLGDPIDAVMAREWGLVNRVVENVEFDSALVEVLNLALKAPKRATSTLNRVLAARNVTPGERQRQHGAFVSLFLSPEFEEGIKAFVKDREPTYVENTRLPGDRSDSS